jgi:hypothetical protein
MVRPAVGLASLDRLASDVFVGVTRQGGCNTAAATDHTEARPALVKLSRYDKLQPQITIRNVEPRSDACVLGAGCRHELTGERLPGADFHTALEGVGIERTANPFGPNHLIAARSRKCAEECGHKCR